MASSMITGERRWAASRRGGMTVLGKVAVPKPINLPSQRLENHGLDPNVEIVPKGTLSWGSRPSSAGSNAWGSSVLSPRTEGSSVSPSHRPSSSGGTRPSTAGSVKGHDSVTNAWGANSRPSSASGALTSNHTSVTSLRPRSAETRSGSSQLSRFADSLPDSSGPWGATGAAEKLGVMSSTKDEFSLSSGDFPTLGSEKDNFGKSTKSLDHAAHDHPGPSPGVSSATEKTETDTSDNASRNINVKGGIIDSWRKDGPHEDLPRLGTERWHGDPRPCSNPKIPHHYESWHGASGVNPPGGIWFGGPPGAPYGAPIAPGGFPMEPFPYYRPPVSAPGLPNSQAVPPPGAGHHGHHPKNGDLFRPHMPDSYIRPAIPFRPGFFPGPVAYEGLYGPPMGFCNPNDRDFPFVGRPSGPPVYNRYPNHNAADPASSHARSSEGRAPDEVESGPPQDSRERSKSLMKQNNGWDQKDDESKWGNKMTNNAYGFEKDLPQLSVQENAQIEGNRKDERIIYGKGAPGEEASSQSFKDKAGTVFPANAKLPGSTATAVTAISPMVESVDFPRENTLMKKIESLNAKARASDGRHDLASGFHREETQFGAQVVNSGADHPTTEANFGVVYLERHHPSAVLVPVSCDLSISMGEKNVETAVGSVTTFSRKTMYGMHIRGDHRVKGRLNSPEGDGWRKKNAGSESPNTVAGAASETISNHQVHEHPAVLQSSEISKSNIEGKDETVMPALDPSDSQRAKMREMAKQRAVQLQKEEEERTREQKAKALAKLEELNRRSANQAKDSSSQKLEDVATHSAGHHKQEESENRPDLGLESDTSVASMPCGSGNIAHASEYTASSSSFGAESRKSTCEDSVLSQNLTLPVLQDVCPDDTAGNKVAPHMRDFSKQKRVGYKQKQNVPLEKNSSDKSVAISASDVPKDHNDTIVSVSQKIVADEITSAHEVNCHVESLRAADSSVHHKKKSSRSVKNKHKLEEPSSAVSMLQSEKESDVVKNVTENVKLDAPVSKLDPTSGQSLAGSGDVVPSSENHSSLPQEDTHGRVNNSWKQHSKKTMRNVQTTRSAERSHGNDSVVWAPVRLQNKNEVTDDSGQKAAEAALPSAKKDHIVQNTSKSKRAEMERYVPKPVAKELAQQVSIQQSASPSVDQFAADGTHGRTKASGRVGIAAESKTVDSKPRQTRSQGLWRLRVSAESNPTQVSQDGSSSTVDASNKAQMSFGQQQMLKLPELSGKEQPTKPDEQLVKGHALKPDEGNDDDGWNTSEDSISTSPATVPGMKDQGILGRGKQGSFKGHKGSGNNYAIDHKNANGGELDSQYPPADMIQMDRTTTRKDNCFSGDRSTSHWQPKSQAYGAHNQRGNRSRGGHNVSAEGSKASKRECSHTSGLHSPSRNEDSYVDVAQPLTAQSSFENKDACGSQNVRHQEARGEGKAPLRGHANSPSQGPVSDGDPASHGTMDGRNEQHSSGLRRNGNYHSRFGGCETHGDQSSTIQDNKQHYTHANQEKQRQNPQYEYQPVGPYNSHKSNNSEGQTDNLQMGARFRGRGQSHSRRGRGNFNGRQRGNAQINVCYE